ncbi:MAG TPA: hypothetical protein VNW54_12440 [Granulicella sp.]|nr:hypothetical protein [Granulicella sp.]
MGFMSILLVVWGVLLACLLGLLFYNATLTRYEEDQLFLSEANDSEKKQQDEIVAKLRRTQPLVRIFGSLSGLLTLAIAGLYTWDAWQHLR